MKVKMRKFTPLLILLLAVVIASFTVIGRHGIFHLATINNEIKLLENKTRELQSEIIEVKNEMYDLEHNPFALEKKARQELGLSKRGEVVYVFPNQDSH